MTSDTQKQTPKLRFPEFRDSQEWEVNVLGNITLIFDGTHQTPMYVPEGIPFYSVENLISGAKNKFISREDYLIATSKNKPEKGDILITRIGKIGYSQVVDWDYDFSIYVTLAVIKKTNLFNSYYLHCFIQSGWYQTELSKKSLLNAVPAKINMDSLRSTKILLPSHPEQAKIADCLASLDELIGAESQKLEALKTYKKGMMQQLFPAEGETVPKLRFPEFRDAGEWEEVEAVTLFNNRIEKGDEGLPIYSVTINDGMVKRSSLDRKIDDVADPNGNKKVYRGDIAYNMMRIWQGAFGLAIEDCMVSPAYIVLAPQKHVWPEFYSYLMKLPKYMQRLADHSQGITLDRLRLYYKDFGQVLLPCPSIQEQQRIADILTSIDEFIAVQYKQLDTLKQHKQALMQQLFPMSDELQSIEENEQL